jgi:hypothetical protein
MARKLVLVALIALVVCTGFGFKASCTEPPEEWRLTISSTEGGSVTAPGEGMFWYADGEDVKLVAEPEEGYHFAGWIGKVRTLYDASQAKARIHMNLDYTITANFTRLEAGE